YNFWASRKYVFNFSPDDSLSRQFVKFMTTALSGLAISEAIIYVGVRKLHLNELLVKIMATGVTMVINFIVRKLWMERSEEA
ncbi:MAG: GtrA family protein, partial [Erysipelotrichaceae bacterium]|nr:GtrA family protein [Erysipelotrichaceae bacterium]